VVLTLPRLLSTPTGVDRQPEAPPTAAAAGEARRIQATLFYIADNGQELVPVSRQVLYGATPLEQARRLVEALVEPPPDGQRSPVPEGTTVRSVFLAADGNVFVDLGGAIATGHPGGSLNEALTVYAIVNAVTANLPDIAAVQILVEGKQVDTLAGHVDLRYPLGKALEWVRKGQ
jgi:spore germination protein GerM